MSNHRSCATCRHWEEYETQNAKNYALGDCLRYPPTLTRPTVECDDEDLLGATDFPTTMGHQRCGEWQQKAPQPPDESRWFAFTDTLSVRARNCLDLGGVRSFASFDAMRDCDLLALKNFGRTTLQEVRIKRALFAKGPA